MNAPAAAAGDDRACSNCGCSLRLADARIAHYCPDCGQESDPRPPTVLELGRQLVSHYASVEGRLWPTFVGLVGRPGFLTREYLAGRRRRYIIPTRLYLSASLLFFIVVKVFGAGSLTQAEAPPPDAEARARTAAAVTQAIDKAKNSVKDPATRADLAEAARALRATRRGEPVPAAMPDATAGQVAAGDVQPGTATASRPLSPPSGEASAPAAASGRPPLRFSTTAPDAAGTTPNTGKAGVHLQKNRPPVAINVDGLPMFNFGSGKDASDQPFLKGVNCKGMGTACEKLRDYMHEKYGDISMRDFGRQVKARTLSYAPYAMFLLLPVFALLTRILYWRRGLYYAEHMVYALHVHSFAFLLLLTASVVPQPVTEFVMLGGVIYFWMAMQRVFGGRWWMTAMRYAFIGSLYPIIISFSVLFVFLLAIFF